MSTYSESPLRGDPYRCSSSFSKNTFNHMTSVGKEMGGSGCGCGSGYSDRAEILGLIIAFFVENIAQLILK